MAMASQIAALNNAINNQKKLNFAKKNFSNKLYCEVLKEYKKAKWGQLAVVLILPLMLLPCLFIKDETIALSILLLATVFWIIPIFPLWIIISNLTFAKKWNQYSKWFEKGKNIEEVYDIFGIPFK